MKEKRKNKKSMREKISILEMKLFFGDIPK